MGCVEKSSEKVHSSQVEKHRLPYAQFHRFSMKGNRSCNSPIAIASWNIFCKYWCLILHSHLHRSQNDLLCVLKNPKGPNDRREITLTCRPYFHAYFSQTCQINFGWSAGKIVYMKLHTEIPKEIEFGQGNARQFLGILFQMIESMAWFFIDWIVSYEYTMNTNKLPGHTCTSHRHVWAAARRTVWQSHKSNARVKGSDAIKSSLSIKMRFRKKILESA